MNSVRSLIIVAVAVYLLAYLAPALEKLGAESDLARILLESIGRMFTW